MLVSRRHRQVGLHDVQRLENHAFPNSGVAFVHRQQQAFAVQHLVVHPTLAQLRKLCGRRFPSERGFEQGSGLHVNFWSYSDHTGIILALEHHRVRCKNDGAQQQKMNQRLAHQWLHCHAYFFEQGKNHRSFTISTLKIIKG